MKSGAAALACLVVLLILGCGESSNSEPATARHPYSVVEGWPALAPGVMTGQVTGLGLARNDKLWLFHRADHPWNGDPAPTSLIPAATLLELTADTGAVVSAMGQSQFVIPHGLFVDTKGHLWVTDVGLHTVVEMDANGNTLRTLGTPRIFGSDESHFDKPTDVYVSPDGTIFVADGYGNARVCVFHADGTFARQWGTYGTGSGEFDTPHSIVGDDAGRIYVADRGNARVQIFDSEGHLLDIWQSPALGRPWAISIAANGDIFVLDGGDQNPQPPDRAKVMRVDENGEVLESFGAGGTAPGEFDWPHDLAVSRSGEVFVGEVHYGERVQKFERRP